jgi:hypothetical protein
MIRQKREQKLGNIFRESRMRFYPNDSEMFRQRQYNPIAKMSIECNQRALLLHDSFKNQCVVSARVTGFGRTEDIIPGIAQKRGQFGPEHLIEVQAREDLRRIKGRDFRVQNGLPGVLQGRLNIIACQFWIAVLQRIPGITIGQLFQNGGHRNSSALDDRLTAANTRVDFNALTHAFNDTRASYKSQAQEISSACQRAFVLLNLSE